jgi:MYXO-CTERM domain-containing protein
MATPAVAGIVALMLERNRDLTVEQIRTILTSTANTMDAPGAPNTSWGAGKIDALAAVNAVTPYVAPPADAGTDSGNPAVDAGADGSADDAGTDSGNPAVDAGADSSAPSTSDAGSSAPAPTTTPTTPPTTPTVPASPPTKSDTAPSSTSSSSGCQTTPAGSNAGGSLALLPTLLATLGFRRRSREKKPSSRL